MPIPALVPLLRPVGEGGAGSVLEVDAGRLYVAAGVAGFYSERHGQSANLQQCLV
jgi:hypothetical protein